MKHLALLGLLIWTLAPAAAAQKKPVPRPTDLQIRPSLPLVKALRFANVGRMRNQATVTGGQEARGVVELSAPAPCVVGGCGTYANGQPAGGMMVDLSSSNTTLARVPAPGKIMVPVGKTSEKFSLITSGVAAATAVTISAWRQGSAPQTASLTIEPPNLTRITVDPSVTGGGIARATAVFNGPPASAGSVVAKLSSSSPAAVVPQTVTLEMNKTVVAFDVKTTGVAADTKVVISGVQGEYMESAPLNVLPAVMTEFKRTFPCLCGPLTITLNGSAPPGGAVVQTSSNNPAAATVPASITVPAGSNSATVEVTQHNTYSVQHATISATLGGVTKNYDQYVNRMLKPDLAVKSVTFQDRFGNPIVHPVDSQPFKICITNALLGANENGIYQYPPPTALRIAYLGPTGTGTSVGHEWDLNVVWVHQTGSVFVANDFSYYYQAPMCVELPGLAEAGSYFDITLTSDFGNKVDEQHEGNNVFRVRITR